MGGEKGEVVPDQLVDDPTLFIVRVYTADLPKDQRVVGDNQLTLFVDRFIDNSLGDIETDEDSFYILLIVTYEKSDVIIIQLYLGGCPLVYKVGDMPDLRVEATHPLRMVRVGRVDFSGHLAACFMPQNLENIRCKLRFFTESEITIYFPLVKGLFFIIAACSCLSLPI